MRIETQGGYGFTFLEIQIPREDQNNNVSVFL